VQRRIITLVHKVLNFRTYLLLLRGFYYLANFRNFLIFLSFVIYYKFQQKIVVLFEFLGLCQGRPTSGAFCFDFLLLLLTSRLGVESTAM
jgi:hypothetical protein